MVTSDYISIASAVITIISMVVTIIYANKAKSYKKQIQQDIRKLNLSNIVDILKNAQDEIRKLPKVMPIKRGIKVEIMFTSIQTYFDNVLNILDSDGPDTKIRTYISEAQTSLTSYEIELSSGKCNSDLVISMIESIQEAISKSNTRIFALEKDL